MDTPWGTGHVHMCDRRIYPSISDYVAAQNWNSSDLSLLYEAPRRSGVYLAQDFYCYMPKITCDLVPVLPPPCHTSYDCLRGVSFFVEFETEISFLAEAEEHRFNGDLIRIPNLVKPVKLYPGHNIIVWCDSEFPVSVDWTCISNYQENCGAKFGNRGWSRWDYYLNCPRKVVAGTPLPPWTVRQIPEEIIGRSSGAYRVYRHSIIPQTGLSVLIWPPRHQHMPPSLSIMSRVTTDANLAVEREGFGDLEYGAVAGDFHLTQIKKVSHVVIMFDPLPPNSDSEDEDWKHYT